MKHTRKALVFMILLVAPLLFSGVMPSGIQEEAKTVVTQSPVNVNVPSYEEIEPISAIGNVDFLVYATDYAWDGDGSPGNPFIIQGYNISVDQNCIEISDVSLAFEIRNCYLYAAPEAIDPDNGITISNCSQVAIYDTIIMNKYFGILMYDTPAPCIENCTLLGGDYGINLYNCTAGTVHECNLYENSGALIELFDSNSTMISNNVLNASILETGVKLDFSHHVTIIENHIFGCAESGIWARESSYIAIEDNVINHNSFFTGGMCGIHLEDSDHATIVGNLIYENSRNGIYLDNSDWVEIFENEIYANSDHGIYAVDSTIGIIEHNNIFENGWWPVIVNELCGIYLGSGSNDWYISENWIWNNTPAGISVEFANDIQISNNDIYNNSHRAIYGYSYGVNEDLRILENEIFGNGWDSAGAGISLYGYENCSIERNQVYNCTGLGISIHGFGCNITNNEVYDIIGHGIASHGANANIIDNEVYSNTEHGINIEMTSSNLVLENTVYDNGDAGIFLYSTYTDVIRNIVYDNDVGIHLYGSQWCNMYGNDIGWNDINALQEYGQPNNEWNAVFDDFGNWWHDHVAPTGEGINRYVITNGTDGVASDHYPECSLNMTTASPVSYEILETGNVLVWEAYALNPGYYYVWVDSVYLGSEPWDGGDITLNVDELPHGFHEVELSPFHISGHGLFAESNVTVEDLTPPSDIEGPDGISEGLGTPFSVQYSSEDPSGVTWTVNNTVAFTISSTGVLSNATALPLGEYVILISATDPYGHSTTKIVTVTIVPDPGGFPPTLLLAVGAGGAIVLLIVGALVYKTKRS